MDETIFVQSTNDNDNDDALKNWIWDNYQQQIKESISFRPCTEFSILEKSNQRLMLLDRITQVQQQYMLNEEVWKPV